MVGRHAVAAQQGEVFDIRGGFGLLAVHQIGEGNRVARLARHLETHYEGLSSRRAAIAFRRVQLPHLAIELGTEYSGCDGEPSIPRVDRQWREIPIGQSLLQDFVRSPAMQIMPFRLPVNLVPVEIQPVQAVEDGIEGGLGVALDVGVVNAQDHGAWFAAGRAVPGIEPIEDEGSRAADVQIASRRGSKANSQH